MNFGRSDESSDAAAALNNAIALERCESMPRSHQADLVDLREVSLGGNCVTCAQLPCFNTLTNSALNPLVGGYAVLVPLRHSISRRAARPDLTERCDTASSLKD